MPNVAILSSLVTLNLIRGPWRNVEYRIRAIVMRVLALISGLGLLISVPVQAEVGEDGASALQFWRFANCAIERDKWRVDRLLAAPRSSEASKQEARTLTSKNPGCLARGQLKMSSGILRDAIAGAYVARFFKQADVDHFLTVTEIYSVDRLAGSVEPKERLELGLRRFAECVSRKDFPRVAALLGTEPNSKEEIALFSDLGVTMNACIPVEKGTKVGFGRLDLRVRLGSVAYELVAAAKLEPTNA